MPETYGPFIDLIVSTGPVGAIVAGMLIALALIVIVYAQTSGIFADRRAAKQGGDFQERLLKAIELLSEGELAVRAENAALREEIARLQASVALMREQQRRTFDLLHRIMEGTLSPAALTPADLAPAPDPA